MTQDPKLPPDPNAPRNVDQQLPKRTGDAIANTSTDAHEQERGRSAPVPEEETFEREPRNQRQR
jgi:hypothetical protein